MARGLTWRRNAKAPEGDADASTQSTRPSTTDDDIHRQGHPKREPTAEEQAASQLAREKYNAWKRHLKREPRINDIGTMKLIWEGALKILNAEDLNCKQVLARDLDDQNLHGRQHMRILLEMAVHEDGALTFVKLARPLILVLSHADFLNCLAVDSAVGAIYNFFGGGNGTRAISFFHTLIVSLSEVRSSFDTSVVFPGLEETFVGALISLRELLRKEQRVTFNDDTPDLLSKYEEFSKDFADQDAVSSSRANSILGELRGMIARAHGLLHRSEPKIKGVSSKVVSSTFPKEFEPPGGRHDNDWLDITEIQILPTESEIKSERREFLPSTDRDQPHFLLDPVQRHIDTNFRLYCHDIFGALKEEIGGFMLAAEKHPAIMDDPRLCIGDIRSSCIFHNAYISDLKLHRRRGLEAYITFQQPHTLRKYTAEERRRWWTEIKRLNFVSLLCHISFNSTKTSLLFFVVSERGTSLSEKKPGLARHPELATITVTFATRSQTDFDLMTQLRCERTGGLLVELPGVIPGTFIPVLENLQSMQRESRLPFRKWILPEHASDAGSLTIPPPLYARDEDFSFSLKPLLKDPSDDLFIDANTSPDIIDIISNSTELDRGQCEALIAALTREFAFIQGPPGTGKWSLFRRRPAAVV